ncbi:MAG: hypothetical protein MHPSP_002529 [Paramarteilia canceri]
MSVPLVDSSKKDHQEQYESNNCNKYIDSANHLSNLIKKYEEKIKKSHFSLREKSAELKKVKSDYEDILAYKSKIITDQNLKYEEISLELKHSSEKYQQQLDDLELSAMKSTKQMQKTIDELQGKLEIQSKKMDDVEEYLEKKVELENEIGGLKKIIDDQQVRFTEELHSRDMENIHNISK